MDVDEMHGSNELLSKLEMIYCQLAELAMRITVEEIITWSTASCSCVSRSPIFFDLV